MNTINGKSYTQIDREHSLLEALEDMHKVDGLDSMIEVVNDYLNEKTPVAWKLEPIMSKEEMDSYTDFRSIDVDMNSINGGK